MRGVRGPISTVPSSAILVGSVTSYHALGTLTPRFPVPGGGGVCGGSALCPFVPIPFLVALCLVPNPMFRSPREEVSEVLSFREPKRLWLYCPKHGLL